MKKAFVLKRLSTSRQKNLVEVINEMGNPFLDDGYELLALDTRDVIDESVVITVRTVESLGKEKYEAYQQSVIKNFTGSIHDSLKKNSLPLFRYLQ